MIWDEKRFIEICQAWPVIEQTLGIGTGAGAGTSQFLLTEIYNKSFKICLVSLSSAFDFPIKAVDGFFNNCVFHLIIVIQVIDIGA